MWRRKSSHPLLWRARCKEDVFTGTDGTGQGRFRKEMTSRHGAGSSAISESDGENNLALSGGLEDLRQFPRACRVSSLQEDSRFIISNCVILESSHLLGACFSFGMGRVGVEFWTLCSVFISDVGLVDSISLSSSF